MPGPAWVGSRRVVGLGWQRDVPDRRDWTLLSEPVQNVIKTRKLRMLGARAGIQLPPAVDNRQFCSPIEDQEQLGSCTAQSVVGMMEYMMRRAGVPHMDGSRLFLYKVTRRLMGLTGDTGASIRQTIKAAAVFGVPPETHWPYELDHFEVEPEAFLYAYASNYQALNYARLDAPGRSVPALLEDIWFALAAGFAISFGFAVYDSIGNDADIPFPADDDRMIGGHAVTAVGYDDDRVIGSYTGALLIRNSWGPYWGDGGYGWLPYAYIEAGLASDFWTIFKEEWIVPGRFG
ncbi:MAG: C1 family peptidase [Planctomycetota bacterium]